MPPSERVDLDGRCRRYYDRDPLGVCCPGVWVNRGAASDGLPVRPTARKEWQGMAEGMGKLLLLPLRALVPTGLAGAKTGPLPPAPVRVLQNPLDPPQPGAIILQPP